MWSLAVVTCGEKDYLNCSYVNLMLAETTLHIGTHNIISINFYLFVVVNFYYVCSAFLLNNMDRKHLVV